MKKLQILPIMFFLATPLSAIDLNTAKFTQVINNVNVVSVAKKSVSKAELDAEVEAPDLIRTGPKSLAELVAPDKTITRVGANTVFSFAKKGREVNLDRGSLLFHSPRGKGGGIIRTKAASASVLGTTLVCTATIDGGFKCIGLEGRIRVNLPNGDFRILNGGQVTFVLPGEKGFGPTLEVNLEKLVEGSNLIQKFEEELPSRDKIETEVKKQAQKIERGEVKDTGLLIGQKADEDEVQVIKATVIEQTVENKTPLQRALETSSVQSGTTIDASKVFSNPPNPIPGLAGSFNQALVGKNLAFTGSGINFGPYTGAGNFGVLAYSTLNISPSGVTTASTRQTASTSANTFSLFASTPEAASGGTTPATTTVPLNVTLAGAQGLSVKNDTVIQATGIGNLTLGSGAGIDFQNVSVFNQGGSISVNANTDLEVNRGTYQPYAIGYLNVRSASGNVIADSITPNATAVAMQAAQAMTVANVNFANASSIAMDARTINLTSVYFAAGSIVNLRSQLGLLAPNANRGEPSRTGYVNFIQNVMYGGDEAQHHVGSGINISALP